MGRKAIQVPKKCTIQAVFFDFSFNVENLKILFNPNGFVVKLFIVEVDVNDMPIRSKTFIRQRTISGGNSDSEAIKDSERLSRFHQGVLKTQPNSQLKFLIHLRYFFSILKELV